MRTFVNFGESRVAENGTQFLCFLALRVCAEQLVHRVGVVFSRLALAYALVFKTGQRRQNVDRRSDAFLVKFARMMICPSVI